VVLNANARPFDELLCSLMSELEELAQWINERARETLESDGEHALMFFSGSFARSRLRLV
jgi:hypothetical protein